jgi:hypothetical protein
MDANKSDLLVSILIGITVALALPVAAISINGDFADQPVR